MNGQRPSPAAIEQWEAGILFKGQLISAHTSTAGDGHTLEKKKEVRKLVLLWCCTCNSVNSCIIRRLIVRV